MYPDEIMIPHSLWLDYENGDPIGYMPGRRMEKPAFSLLLVCGGFPGNSAGKEPFLFWEDLLEKG